MTSLIIPDVNVWLALHYDGHIHHELSTEWYKLQDESCVLNFCRQTQLGLFRSLTNTTILRKDTYTQRQCWQLYEEWMTSGRARMMAEPYELERYFKARTKSDQSSSKEWADAYLAALAEAVGLQLATFDKALAGKSKGAILLG